MVTNFDYLKKDQKFSKFADVAISAEKVILLDPEACIINCRRAMEFAVKWVYSMDNLEMPYRDNLHSLLEADDFRQTVGSDLWRRLDYIRKTGNSIAHNSKKKAEMKQCFVWKIYLFLWITSRIVMQISMKIEILMKELFLQELIKQKNQSKLPKMQKKS